MKKLFALLAVFMAFSLQAHAAECVKPIFEGETKDKIIKVHVCMLDNGHVLYQQFTEGRDKPTEVFENTVDQTSYVNHHAGGIQLKEFNMMNGDIKYNVTDGVNDEGKAFGSITFTNTSPSCKGEGCYTSVDLDPATVYSSINDDYSKMGIPESDEL